MSARIGAWLRRPLPGWIRWTGIAVGVSSIALDALPPSLGGGVTWYTVAQAALVTFLAMSARSVRMTCPDGA